MSLDALCYLFLSSSLYQDVCQKAMLYRKKIAKLNNCNDFDCINQIDKRKDQQIVYASNRYILDEKYKQEKRDAYKKKVRSYERI